MDHELLRLDCLRMAQSEGNKGDDLVARAQELFDFLRYGRDGATENRRIVAGQTNGIVTVRGKGNDQEFRDYIKDKFEEK